MNLRETGVPIESEEKLSAILSSLDDLVFAVDADGCLTDFHKPVSLSALHTSFEDCVGRPLRDVFPPRVFRMIEEAIRVVRVSGTVQQFDCPLLVAGEERWFSAKVSPRCASPTEFAGVTILARDISYRRVLEEALQENEWRLNLLFEYAPDGYFLIDPQGILVDGNRAAMELLGYRKEELLNRNLFHTSILPPHCIPKAKALLREAVSRAGGPEELVVNRKDGSSSTVEVTTHPARISDRPLILTIARDVTARKRTERKLIEQQSLLRTLFSSTPNILVMKDQALRYQAVNQAFCRFVGAKEEQVIGKTDFDFFPRREAERSQRSDLRVLSTAGPVFQDERIVREGERRYFSVSKVPVLDGAGQPVGLVVSQTDTTDLYRYAEQLQEAKREAESANLAKTEFLANISHELRTPLTAILGFSEILDTGMTGPMSKRQHRYLQAILDGGKHLLDLINDILDLSKIDFGAMQLDLADIDMRSLIERSLLAVREKAARQLLTVDLEVPEGAGSLRMRGDERKLKQILYNLLSNAVKFTPPGGRITVSAGRQGDLLFLRVMDSGIGIEPEEQKKIFNEFYQVKSKTKNSTTGTGLGLSLTRRLVELHGGRIGVESEGPGKGSCFVCVFPLEPQKAQQQKPNRRTRAKQEVGAQLCGIAGRKA
jgi:PAS domain S-box-containing protein